MYHDVTEQFIHRFDDVIVIVMSEINVIYKYIHKPIS